MPENIVQQLISRHLASGEMKAGAEISIAIDHTLLQDATGAMAMLEFEAMSVPRVKTKRSVTYADHNTLQIGFENMDDHRYLETACARYGAYFSRVGNGICHQVNLERFSVPGDTLLGADSHTTTGGGVGMLAIGAGGLDVALAMAGKPFYLNMPTVMKVELTGSLPDWCAAKDVCLEILRRLSVSGGRGRILEFTGPGVANLSVPQRATITNMSIETGAFTAVFPSDDVTKEFFKAQERLGEWREVKAEAGCSYDEEMKLDLSGLEPLMARPSSPDNVAPVTSELGLKVDQVAVGSCTNSSMADLLRVASMLKGKRVPPGMSLIIAPGTRQVLQELAGSGALNDIVASGARLMECACGFCVGIGQSPVSGGVSLRTANRNFPGRSGTKDAKVYLVSAEVAIASALAGHIADPRELGVPEKINLPEKYLVDDSMVNPPAPEGNDIQVVRGPNIVPLPEFEPVPDSLTAEVLINCGDDITTDDIIPGGAQIMSLRANAERISQYMFSRYDTEFVERAEAAKTGVIVAGKNYGQGSSREHAALCPRFMGVRAVLAESFARIHKANLVNFGILPLEFVDPGQRGKIDIHDHLEISGIENALAGKGDPKVKNPATGEDIPVRLDISPRLAGMLKAGGAMNMAGK